jgi:hypothetical protein
VSRLFTRRVLPSHGLREGRIRQYKQAEKA